MYVCLSVTSADLEAKDPSAPRSHLHLVGRLEPGAGWARRGFGWQILTEEM